jgi:hypothetical protein
MDRDSKRRGHLLNLLFPEERPLSYIAKSLPRMAAAHPGQWFCWLLVPATGLHAHLILGTLVVTYY